MDRNFAKSLKLVLKYEGGYINHPSDPGGPTNKGVTLATFRRYVKPGGSIADLKAITDVEVATVYRNQYWRAVDGDGLPSGVDFAMFDFAVNSGPGRALKYSHKSIDELCDARLAFMKRINGGKLWKTFGKGWAARVADVRKNAKAMAASTRPAAAATIPIEPKPAPAPALVPVKVPGLDKPMVKSSTMWAALGGTGLTGLAGGKDVIDSMTGLDWRVTMAIVGLAAAFAAYWIISQRIKYRQAQRDMVAGVKAASAEQ